MLEVLSKLETCLFYAKDILTGTRGQFISETIVRKTGQTVISEHICMPATHELLHDKYLSLPNDNYVYCVTSEHTRG